MKKQKKCAVCGRKSITTKKISINNAPKVFHPLCKIHADAADEDEEHYSPFDDTMECHESFAR